ncbi:MAG: hypothetical protein LC790_03690 [Actinobacteria bacterium]|nr:hypothetical protein [Actinomycetota bacterium]MCA1698038.1 hypothetical protein [Actinomycetota bacterium]
MSVKAEATPASISPGTWDGTEDPARGWYCFGCGRGGSIYDLAALLWQRRTRGEDFRQLRRELDAFVS